MNIAILDVFSDVCLRENNVSLLCYHNYLARKQIQHGDLVYFTVKKYVEDINCYCYSIFDSIDNCIESYFHSAINQIIQNENIEVVLLCFTPANIDSYIKIKTYVNRLLSYGKFVIVADSNRKKNSFWEGMKNNIIIKKGAVLKEPYYIKTGENTYIGDASPEFLYVDAIKKYFMFSGTSKAAPKILRTVKAGIDLGIKENRDLEKFLEEHSGKSSDDMVREFSKGVITLKDKTICKKVICIINTFFGDKKLDWNEVKIKDIYFDDLRMNIQEYAELVIFCLSNFEALSILDSLTYFDFCSIYSLSNCIYNNVLL